MTVSISNLCWKMITLTLTLPQVKELKYHRILFTCDGKMEWYMNWRFGAASTVWGLLRTSVVNRELSWKAKLSIYQSFYVPTFTYGQEL